VRCIAFQGADVWIGTADGLVRGTDRGPWVSLPAARTSAAPTESAAGGPREPPIDRTFTEPALAEDRAGIEVVYIAVLRPGNKVITVPGSEVPGQRRVGYLDRLAVNLAIEQANARGGYRGKIPYGLTTGPEGAFRGWGWTTPEDDLSALSQRSDVWGIVGHLGPNCRMSSAAILKSEVPLVNIGIAPATIDERINPWVFRCRGDEPRQLRRLLEYVFDRVGHARIALLRTPGRESETHIEWWRTHARRRGHPAVAVLRFDPRRDDLDSKLREVRRLGAQALMTWCEPQLSAVILRRMRAIGMSQMFVGSHQIVSGEFLKLIGEDPGAVIAAWPLASRWNRRAAGRFSEDYTERFHRRPALHAYPLYEAARHLLEAINIAGLNREAIRETLRKMSLRSEGEKHCERSPYEASDIVLGYVDGETWKLHMEAAEP
jgi:ABC-type branched-subunit amino acid transport system substrate-binding protein